MYSEGTRVQRVHVFRGTCVQRVHVFRGYLCIQMVHMFRGYVCSESTCMYSVVHVVMYSDGTHVLRVHVASGLEPLHVLLLMLECSGVQTKLIAAWPSFSSSAISIGSYSPSSASLPSMYQPCSWFVCTVSLCSCKYPSS